MFCEIYYLGCFGGYRGELAEFSVDYWLVVCFGLGLRLGLGLRVRSRRSRSGSGGRCRKFWA